MLEVILISVFETHVTPLVSFTKHTEFGEALRMYSVNVSAFSLNDIIKDREKNEKKKWEKLFSK